MKILVLGAGAVGGYFFGRLAQHGVTVDIICRSDYDVVRKKGYKIKSIDGDFLFKPHRVFNSVDQAAGSDYDYVALTTKSLPETDIIGPLKKVVGQAAIVQIQNGVEIEAPLAQAFNNNELISSVAYIGVYRKNPGEIIHQGAGRLRMGLYQGKSEKAIDTLVSSFQTAKVDCQKVDDIQTRRWLKLLWNAPFNSLSVIGGKLDTREMIDDKRTAQLAENIMLDIQKTAKCLGVHLSKEDIQWTLDYTRKFPAYKSSMLVDFEAKRPLEVESILGNALRIAESHGIKTPYLQTAYTLLRTIDNKNKKRDNQP